MKHEPSLIEILKSFQKKKLRYLLIGGHAVNQYGSPGITKDFDFWIDSNQREIALNVLAERGFDLPPKEDWTHPILNAYADWEKIDLFFTRRMMNLENRLLDFEDFYAKSTLFIDDKKGFAVRVPSIEDLIALKKMRKPNAKDSLDIAFLEKLLQKKT